MSKFFKNHNLKLDIKVSFLRFYEFSILYHGMESWTLSESIEKNLEAFEMWFYRKIVRIPWVDIVANETVLERMRKKKRSGVRD